MLYIGDNKILIKLLYHYIIYYYNYIITYIIILSRFYYRLYITPLILRYNFGNFRPFTCFQSDICQMSYWYNWFSWRWAHGCSKQVENRNKHIRKKNCASSWLFKKSYTEMHGQQDIKRRMDLLFRYKKHGFIHARSRQMVPFPFSILLGLLYHKRELEFAL